MSDRGLSPIAAIKRVGRCVRGLRRLRALDDHELAFLKREFGTSLPVERLRLAGGGQPTGRCAWQPAGGLIQMDDTLFEQTDPRGALRISAYPTLAHEALHVWQRVHGHCTVGVSVDGLWLGITRGRRAYGYDAGIREPWAMLQQFLAGNIEQQGQMFEDYVRSSIADPALRHPKFALIAEYVRAGSCNGSATGPLRPGGSVPQ